MSLDIFGYLDFRLFCRDFYRTKKLENSKFSYRKFAQKAGIAGAYLKHVIDGIRNLSPEMAIRFAQGMDLSAREIDYFETLVRFNQAQTHDERALFFERLRRKRSKALKPLGLTEAVDLLSHWYVIALKELVVSLNTTNAKILQKMLRKRLSEKMIEKTVHKLHKLGWITQTNGQWVSSAAQIQFPDEVRSYVIQSFHRQMLSLAGEALEDDLSAREFGSAVFTFPRNRISELKNKVKDIQKDLLAFVQDINAQAGSADLRSVYQVGLQCFSLQKNLEKVEDLSLEVEVSNLRPNPGRQGGESDEHNAHLQTEPSFIDSDPSPPSRMSPSRDGFTEIVQE